MILTPRGAGGGNSALNRRTQEEGLRRTYGSPRTLAVVDEALAAYQPAVVCLLQFSSDVHRGEERAEDPEKQPNSARKCETTEPIV